MTHSLNQGREDRCSQLHCSERDQPLRTQASALPQHPSQVEYLANRRPIQNNDRASVQHPQGPLHRITAIQNGNLRHLHLGDMLRGSLHDQHRGAGHLLKPLSH